MNGVGLSVDSFHFLFCSACICFEWTKLFFHPENRYVKRFISVFLSLDLLCDAPVFR